MASNKKQWDKEAAETKNKTFCASCRIESVVVTLGRCASCYRKYITASQKHKEDESEYVKALRKSMGLNNDKV
jgi:hypothetical protein